MEKNLINLKTQHTLASNIKIMDGICHVIYQEILVIIEELASFGQWELCLSLSGQASDGYIVPKLIYHYKNIQSKLEEKITSQGFACHIKDDSIHILWNKENDYSPTILAKDLTHMGYSTNQFGTILHGLKVAIAKGEATSLTIQSQIFWIKEHFPLK
jgi:hypothetical protein